MTTQIVGLTHTGLGRTAEGDFLPRVLPGETVEPADPPRIVTPSTDRVKPPCRHFKSCGGCAMQHASDVFVAGWKQDVVVRALSAQGLAPPFRPIYTSPPQSRRRAKFSGKRTKGGALVGFHARGSGKVIAIPDCHLLTPGLMAAIPACEALTVLAASRKSEVAMTVTDSAAGPDILVETDKPLTPDLRIALAQFAQAHRVARLTWNDEPVVTLVPPAQHFGLTPVVPPPGAFLQATEDGEAALRAGVDEITQGAKRIVDLFAGVGTFAIPLSRWSEVHAVEGEAALMAALDDGWRKGTGLKRISTETRDLYRRPLEPDELRYDAAVIDPPRAGAEAQINRLAASDIPVISMVSCNPVTFARDARTLTQAGYTLDWVQVVDQFRWAAHVEVVASFTRS